MLENKKAENIDVIDVSKFSSVCDLLVIATSNSTPQTNAIAVSLGHELKKIGVLPLKWEGRAQSNWMILDLGSIIVHIMGPEERQKYSLEEIWGKTAVTYHM